MATTKKKTTGFKSNAERMKGWQSQLQKTQTATAAKPAPAAPAWSQYIPKNMVGMQNAAVKDLSDKYGFKFTQDDANKQAELERQQKEGGLRNQQQQIDTDLRGATNKMEDNYFQQMLTRQQGATNTGMAGSGIAQGQELQANLGQQRAFGEMMGAANKARTDIEGQIAGLGAEAEVRKDQLMREWLQKQFENSMQLTQEGNRSAQFDQQLGFDKSRFEKEFGLEGQRFLLEKDKFKEETKMGWAKLAEEKRQFNSELEWRKHEYNNMSATDRAQLEWAKTQFGEDMAWKYYELSKSSELTREGWSMAAGDAAGYGGGGSGNWGWVAP